MVLMFIIIVSYIPKTFHVFKKIHLILTTTQGGKQGRIFIPILLTKKLSSREVKQYATGPRSPLASSRAEAQLLHNPMFPPIILLDSFLIKVLFSFCYSLFTFSFFKIFFSTVALTFIRLTISLGVKKKFQARPISELFSSCHLLDCQGEYISELQ